METLTKVHLLGKLGALFGRDWELNVKSPSEAIRAIDVNLKGKLREYLSGRGGKKYYKIAIQKKDNVIDTSEINNRSGTGDIYIIPTIKGSNAVTKIVVGVVLIVLAVVFQQYEFLPYILASMGASLVLGGITQLLTPVPKNTKTDQRQSVDFQGNAASATQGGCIPVIYGKALASPIPVSISYSAYKVATTSFWGGGNFAPGLMGGGQNISPSTLQGGGYAYAPFGLYSDHWNPSLIFTNGQPVG